MEKITPFLILLVAFLTFAWPSVLSGVDIKAVIFDCDGILVDTEYLKYLAWREALGTKNIDFSIEEYNPLVGHSSKNILSALQKAKGIEIPKDVIELKNDYYRMLQKKGVLPIPEMVALAKHLSAERHNLGIKLGVVSSAPSREIFQNLQQIGLESSFDLIISGSDDLDSYMDLEGKNKPKPYVYIEAAKRLNLPPSHCLVLEDTTAGIEAAHSAGMISIAFPNSFTTSHDFSKAAKVMSSYEDLSLETILKDLKPLEKDMYTLIQRPEMLVIGIECRTSNAPEAGLHDIPRHWEKFFNENVVLRIPNKATDEVIALYCDYEGDHTLPYSLVIGSEVSSLEDIPEGMVAKMLPASTYAMFPAIGEHPKSLINTWKTIWQTDLKRTYTGDFEVYGHKFMADTTKEVDVFIAIE